MKRSFILLVVAMVATLSVWAQVPQTLTYQAVVRDGNGRLICNSNVGVRISILQGSESGVTVYSDQQTVRTNANGLFTLLIGTPENSIVGIDWAAGPYYLKSEIDHTGGSNYTLTTVQQMFSVPYALRAHTVDSIIGGVNYDETDPVFTAWNKDYNDLINRPTIPTMVSELTNDAGYLTFFTESQILSISNDTVFLTGGSYVKLPAGFSGDYNDLTNKPTIPTVPTNVSELANDAGYLTSYTETDPVFTAWDKDYNDLINKPTIPTVPTNVSAFNNDAGYLTSYTEVQTLGNVVALGNAANGQLKEVSDPTEELDAVNMRTLNAIIAVLQHRFDSITHRYDSIMAGCMDTIHQLLTGGFDTNGASLALFSVSDTKQVRFSKGNLQFTTTGTHATAGGGTAIGTWRFAEHQYDYIGEGNVNISSTYTGWIDLFGWGTSGWNSVANEYQPWSRSTENTDYYPSGSNDNDLTGEYANADWGIYNAIFNGGNTAGMWRTLSKDEWNFLVSHRSITYRYAKANINGINGVIIFPDSFTLPVGININNENTPDVPYGSNSYNLWQWITLQNVGCIFLPAAGLRKGTSILYQSEGSGYWTSSYISGGEYVWQQGLGTNMMTMHFGGPNVGRSVRLVMDAE